MAERYIERGARGCYFDIGRDHRLTATDRSAHRASEHRMHTGSAMLHLSRNPDEGAFAIADRWPVQEPDQFWHKPLAESGAHLE